MHITVCVPGFFHTRSIKCIKSKAYADTGRRQKWTSMSISARRARVILSGVSVAQLRVPGYPTAGHRHSHSHHHHLHSHSPPRSPHHASSSTRPASTRVFSAMRLRISCARLAVIPRARARRGRRRWSRKRRRSPPTPSASHPGMIQETRHITVLSCEQQLGFTSTLALHSCEDSDLIRNCYAR